MFYLENNGIWIESQLNQIGSDCFPLYDIKGIGVDQPISTGEASCLNVDLFCYDITQRELTYDINTWCYMMILFEEIPSDLPIRTRFGQVRLHERISSSEESITECLGMARGQKRSVFPPQSCSILNPDWSEGVDPCSF